MSKKDFFSPKVKEVRKLQFIIIEGQQKKHIGAKIFQSQQNVCHKKYLSQKSSLIVPGASLIA